MTLIQAINNATRAGLRIQHAQFAAGELVSLEFLKNCTIPTMIAADNEWELEARQLHLDEHTAKRRLVPVLRKYVRSDQMDEIAEAIMSEFFLEHT